MEQPPPRPPVERSGLVLGVLAAVVLAGWFGWRYLADRQDAPPPAQVPVTSPSEPPASPPLADATSQQPRYPIDATEAAPAEGNQALPALDASDELLGQRLARLLGNEPVAAFVQTDALVRRMVATVDNLSASHAAPSLWPVHPTAGRFSTHRRDDGTEVIHPDNLLRYAPLVRVAAAVDLDQAVAVYRELYPLFQRAYEELGYPGRYFNDRLVEVLDHLIAAPVPEGPLAVTLVEVRGPVPSTRPWVRYEFTDPALARLSVGQKMLLRTGATQQLQLQAVLAGLRSRVARP